MEETGATGTNKNLVTKLVKVMARAQSVKKTGRNDFQKYDYATESDILKEVREELIRQNVFIFSSVEGSHKEGDLTTVRIKNTFVDGDTGETFSVLSLGQGLSKNDDKGSNKAITAASKYFLLKNFLLPTGDDPEATDAEGKSTGGVKTMPVSKVVTAPTGSVDGDMVEGLPATSKPVVSAKPASFRPLKKAVEASTEDF